MTIRGRFWTYEATDCDCGVYWCEARSCDAFQTREEYLKDGDVLSVTNWEMIPANMMDDVCTEPAVQLRLCVVHMRITEEMNAYHE